jgi:hypothetical protein
LPHFAHVRFPANRVESNDHKILALGTNPVGYSKA